MTDHFVYSKDRIYFRGSWYSGVGRGWWIHHPPPPAAAAVVTSVAKACKVYKLLTISSFALSGGGRGGGTLASLVSLCRDFW